MRADCNFKDLSVVSIKALLNSPAKKRCVIVYARKEQSRNSCNDITYREWAELDYFVCS